MSIFQYAQPTVFCAGTSKAQATYNETPKFAPGQFYPKGFGGKSANLILCNASRSTVEEALSVHLIPGDGTCERSSKGRAKLDQDARVVLHLDVRDLHDLAGLLGYRLVPTA
jgi:hypothetical protein